MLAGGLFSLLITACISLPLVDGTGNYVVLKGFSKVTENPTLYSKALTCIGQLLPQDNDLRIAVGPVVDLTNTQSMTDGGMISAAASLMVISALSKANLKLVERENMQVANTEMRYAMDKILGHPNDEGFKKLHAGRVRSSDYYITGGISELNFNIGTNKGELKIPEIGIGVRYAVMNVAVDLRIVDTETLEIVNVISQQKQIIGTETKAGFFDFVGSIFAIGLYNGKRIEPIQLGVRAIIERSVIDFIAHLFQLDPTNCIEQSETALLT